VTVKGRESIWVWPPPVPVTVRVELPTGVVEAVLTSKVEDPVPPATGSGLKLPVAPVGKPLTLRVTAWLNPLLGVTVMLYCVLAPAVTVSCVGEADNEKPDAAAAFTVRFTDAECVRLTLVPVRVTV